MFVSQLSVLSLLVYGSCAFTSQRYNWFYDCNPPEKLVGKFCAALFDNDVDGNGVVNNYDIDYDLLLYNQDDDSCNIQQWEVVNHVTCRYGFSAEYARFLFSRFDLNGDTIVSVAGDFNFPINFTSAQFLSMQYTRYKDQYCSIPQNRNNPVDCLMCAEVDVLNPQDVKC